MNSHFPMFPREDLTRVPFWEKIAQQVQNICIQFIQCWTNVGDVGPTLFKCYTNLLCLLGGS